MKVIFSLLACMCIGCVLSVDIRAEEFNIPHEDLSVALESYATQTGTQFVYASSALKGVRTMGVKGNVSPEAALSELLHGTGFISRKDTSGAIGISRAAQSKLDTTIEVAAQTAPSVSGAALETVTVTSSKIGGDIQNIPISITALSQEQLTATQTAGGPDLIKQVPNMTFTKTNFSGYSIQLRGIGTQAISVTTDPAVAVAFNDTPFIRNHFFEQEFYDVSQVQVLRGPQGTLYGRNATAGVVNLTSAKPSDQFEAMASADIGNYQNRRLEGMINIPIVDDRLDLRIAGEWTKRNGYTNDTTLNTSVDGRDLWSSRVTLGWKPVSDVQTELVWEHFSEDDDRVRSAKQLCKTATVPAYIDGIGTGGTAGTGTVNVFNPENYLDQGCDPTSLYSPSAFGVPDGKTLAYYNPLTFVGAPIQGSYVGNTFNPYASTTQSTNLRDIQSAVLPAYKAKNDTLEFNADWAVSPSLTFTSQTGYNHDFLWSDEDYNRFDTAPGAFAYSLPVAQGGDTSGPNHNGQLIPDPLAGTGNIPANAGVFCDPQLGCSDRLVLQDLSDEHAWQFSQEFRLASNFSGPLNFSAGGNYLHYETEENYYVFINSITLAAAGSKGGPWVPGVSTNSKCLPGGFADVNPHRPADPTSNNGICAYIDPNPIGKVNNEGHNYFLSQNPYTLNSYALFGELSYSIASDLKFTLGARWTEDRKHFTDIPSELFVAGYGYPITGVVNQQWDAPTGRAVLNWSPKLDFSDQTLVYGSYSHGYKAGGANPPGAELLTVHITSGSGDQITLPDHPLTFKPEFIDAFELGNKNSFLDDSLTVNGDIFYYAYRNYQISEIVDRTAINQNFNASVKGAELETNWEPVPGFRLNFSAGYEDATANRGDKAIDLMDRTAGSQGSTCTEISNPTPPPSGQVLSCSSGWVVVKPFVTQASNCILPDYVVAAELELSSFSQGVYEACGVAYNQHLDPLTGLPYKLDPTQVAGGYAPVPAGYPGFDPTQPAINNGEGFNKDLSGNKLPNAPPLTISAGAQYTLPLSSDWAGTLRGDYYWQDYSWARIFNDNPYDRLRGFTTVNLTLIFTNQNGWQVMLYDKNVFNETAITGDFLNSDDSALTTNIFLTDPKLIGIRVTKNW